MINSIGFIGYGNMAQAMIKGILEKGNYHPHQIHVTSAHPDELKQKTSKIGIIPEDNNIKLAQLTDILILSVKPNQYASIINEIKDHIKSNTIIITIAAGQSMALTEKRFSHPIKLIRAMPNTPAMVNMGMTALTPNNQMTQNETQEVKAIFSSFGKASIVPETLMDAVVGISGSSPAFIFMFIEAMADGAVAAGMPRKQAYTFAAQTVMGSAKMVLETGKHPGELKDMVCSPSGTTIDAVENLERNGFRGIVMEAIRTCVEKSIQMS